eukprot:3325679-Amphidinium_carterae.1
MSVQKEDMFVIGSDALGEHRDSKKPSKHWSVCSRSAGHGTKLGLSPCDISRRTISIAMALALASIAKQNPA